jgi:hypothetical protein
MALTNYTDLQAAIASWMVRSDLTSVIPDFITLFEATVNRRLRVRQMETVGTITMSSGTGTLPTDYLAWKRLTWPGSTSMELDYVHPGYLKAAYPTSPAGTPQIWTIEGSSILTRPYDSNNTSLTFLYYAKVPDLATNSTNWLMTAHPDLYLFGSLVEAQAYVLDAEKAALWKLRRDELFFEIEKLSNKTQGPAAPRVMGYVV